MKKYKSSPAFLVGGAPIPFELEQNLLLLFMRHCASGSRLLGVQKLGLIISLSELIITDYSSKMSSLKRTASYNSGQIIATSHDLTPNGGLVREIHGNPLISGKSRLVKYYNLAR